MLLHVVSDCFGTSLCLKVETLTQLAKEKVELAKALLRASVKAKTPAPKAKAEAKAEPKRKGGEESSGASAKKKKE